MELPSLSKVEWRNVAGFAAIVGGTALGCATVGVPAAIGVGLAGLFANVAVADASRRWDAARRNAKQTHPNHDLTLLVGKAIAHALFYSKDQRDGAAHAAWFKKLSDHAQHSYVAIVQHASLEVLASQNLPELLAKAAGDCGAVRLDGVDWPGLVKFIRDEAGQRTNAAAEAIAAERLASGLFADIREMFKRDFELGGRAYPALCLDMHGRTLALLGQIGADQKEALDRFEVREEHLDAIRDQVILAHEQTRAILTSQLKDELDYLLDEFGKSKADALFWSWRGAQYGRDTLAVSLRNQEKLKWVTDFLPKLVDAKDRDTKIVEVSRQLGLATGAIRGFFAALGQQDVPLERWPERLIEHARTHQELRQLLDALTADDTTIARMLADAKAAIANGDYAEAETLLGECERRDCEAAEHAAKQVRARRRRAAETRAGRGKLALLRWAYREAAEHFAEAAALAADLDADLKTLFLHSRADALHQQGLEQGDNAALKESIAAWRELLEQRTRERVPLDWAMTQNNLGAALAALGERESGTERLTGVGEQAISPPLAPIIGEGGAPPDESDSRRVKQMRLELIQDEHDRAIALLTERYDYEVSQAQAAGRGIDDIQKARVLEFQKVEREFYLKRRAEEIRIDAEIAQARLATMTNEFERELASIELRYDTERRLAELAGDPKRVGALNRVRAAEIEAAKAAEALRLRGQAADRAATIAELELRTRFKGLELQRKLLALEREREIKRAQAAGENIADVQREFDLRAKLLEAGHAIGRRGESPGTFSARQAEALGPSRPVLEVLREIARNTRLQLLADAARFGVT